MAHTKKANLRTNVLCFENKDICIKKQSFKEKKLHFAIAFFYITPYTKNYKWGEMV